jgi:hypothetical protein
MSTTQETKIDWSQPVQTKETPPRKVEILSMNGRGSCCVIGYIGDQSSVKSWTLDGKWSAIGGSTEIDIENIPTWKLPDPPPNQQWHRVDGWTEEMLPAGYRPHLLGEIDAEGDEVYVCGKWRKAEVTSVPTRDCDFHRRTTRPIPQQPEQWAAEKAAFAAGETIQYRSDTNPTWVDTKEPLWFSREGHPFSPEYRIKPKQQKVPLDESDIKAGDEFLSPASNTRYPYQSVHNGGIELHGAKYSFQHLMDGGWKIRSIGEAEWRECYKLIDPK